MIELAIRFAGMFILGVAVMYSLFWTGDRMMGQLKDALNGLEEKLDKLVLAVDRLFDALDMTAEAAGNIAFNTRQAADPSYWERMLQSVQNLQAGIPSPAFSKPEDPARRIELSPGCFIHDAHVCLAMIVSKRWSAESGEKMAKAIGYPNVQKMERALIEAIEHQIRLSE